MKKPSYKSVAFRNSGPKLDKAKLAAMPVWLPEEYRDFLLAHNGGIPEKNSFRYPFKGKESISSIDFFYSIKPGSTSYPYDNLIYDGFLGHRNDLPRWSIPIARVDEDSFILLFENGPYRDGVWYFIWIHDDPDSEPYVECRGAIAKVADSIPEFLQQLHGYLEFYSIVSFVVSQDISLSDIRSSTKSQKMHWVEYDDDRGRYACCEWSVLKDKSFLYTTLFFFNNNVIPSTHYAGLKLPRLNVPKNTMVMHLLVSSKFKTFALKNMPKTIGNWRLKPVDGGE